VTREPKKLLRCAVYTRVSSDQGLEQEFNSLDNQREAAEAYVKSQAHEGWRCLSTRYDDGGFSGGSLERPALQKLLADIRERRIDVVVVYKVDRLTRALSDFAKLVELFDAHEVSFVSVTQAFNTTTSMGRLTLNVLLSFAQFEREVTGERIRDKIAASKRKGMRMGGPVPLGYDVLDKKLVINRREAERVRIIFQRYLDVGSLTGLARDLRRRGIVTKISRRGDGSVRGGIPFTKGPLAYLLRNPVYIGEVVHKGKRYPGEHEAILEVDLFGAVQKALAAAKRARSYARANTGSLLTGRIFDDRGNRMTPSTANARGVRYRYYVSCVLAQGRKNDAGSVPRIPAPEIEACVVTAVTEQVPDATQAPHELIAGHLQRVTVHKQKLELRLRADDIDEERRVTIPWTLTPPTRKREILIPHAASAVRPIRAESRARLVEGIAKARLWLDQLVSSKIEGTREIARREHCTERSVRMTLGLAFLSPAIVKAAVDGTLPRGCGVSQCLDMPSSWSGQWRQIAGTHLRTCP
jgi:site-specific DNA recombinase